MKYFFLIFATLLGLTAAQNGIFRFLVTPKTITSTVTVTSSATTFTGITKSCFTSSSSLTNCRRRRHAIESPMILEAVEDDAHINPSAPVKVVATPYPEARAIVPAGNSLPITLNSDGAPLTAVQPSIENTAGMAEVQIRDLDSICKSRAANPFIGVGLAQIFGITVLFSTTVTQTTTNTATVTTVAKTNTFFVAGCIPTSFPFSNC